MTHLGFEQAIWLLPIAIILHVLEELPRFSAWANKTLEVPYTRAKFVAENIVLFVLLMGSIALTLLRPAASIEGQVGLAMVLGALVGTFLNTIFHAVYTLKDGEYSPGTVTACLLFPPTSVYLYWLAATQGLLTPSLVIASIILGVGLLPLVCFVVHRLIDRGVNKRTLAKFAMMAGLPLLLVPLASTVFDREAVHAVMVYAAPLGLLPLALKWIISRKQSKQQGEVAK